MSNLAKSLKPYVASGQYFTDARKWYMSKYIYPISYRSILAIISAISTLAVILLLLITNSLLPLSKQLKYALHYESGSKQLSAKIDKANSIKNNPLLSIASILVKDYIINYEGYNFLELEQQYEYMKNNSTRIVLKEFENNMDTENYNSPVIRYKKEAQRNVLVKQVKMLSARKAEVTFDTIGLDGAGQKFENMRWQAYIEFEVDPINTSAAHKSPYYFIVSKYETKLLRNNSPDN